MGSSPQKIPSNRRQIKVRFEILVKSSTSFLKKFREIGDEDVTQSNQGAPRGKLMSSAMMSPFLGSVMILSSAICSFLGSKFQTRVAFHATRAPNRPAGVYREKE